MGVHGGVWEAAASLNLTTEELGRVLGVAQSVASRKMRGKVAWTLRDCEALNRVLPPERQLVIAPTASTMPTPIMAPLRARTPRVPGRVARSGYGFDTAGREVPLKAHRSTDVKARREAVLAALAAGRRQSDIAFDLGVSATTVGRDTRALREQGRLVSLPRVAITNASAPPLPAPAGSTSNSPTTLFANAGERDATLVNSISSMPGSLGGESA